MKGAFMDKPWFMFSTDDEHLFDPQGFSVPFGNTNFDVKFGGAHDLDIPAPPNHPVTALLSGTLASVTKPPPPWGEQVGVELHPPFNGISFMAYLHLSAVNPALVVGQRIEKGDLIGWVGGGNSDADYGTTSNPTHHNFTNPTFHSSRVQVGVALMRGREFGITDFNQWPPIELDLDPSQIIYAARKAFLEDGMLQITDPFAAAHFTQVNEKHWHSVSTNKDVIAGILKFYRSIGGAPRLPLTGEQHDPVHGVTYQVFEAGVIVFDPDHKLDHPAGFEASYLLKLDSDLAKEILPPRPS
jgi:hypothetical protein